MNVTPSPQAFVRSSDSPRGVRLASRMAGMKPSAVREILKVAERPDILSFAGGLPAPELFPVQELAAAHARVFEREGASALQYSTTEGYGPLREWLVARLARRGIHSSLPQLLITSGAQQGIELLAKTLLDEGDVVLVEDPTYLAALQVFGSYGARVVAIPGDDEGMRVERIEALLLQHRPKLIYIVTDFHNPKGTSLSLSRRRELVRLATKHQTPILEDDPYGELRFQGEHLPPLASLDEEGWVVYLGTFSKTLAPGLRLGWMHGPRTLVRAATVAKQAADLHSGTLAQRAAAALLEQFDYDGHLQTLRSTYGARCEAMLEAGARELPRGTRWTRPEGGLFLWVELPAGLEDDAFLEAALAQKVAFVPGHPFFVQSPAPHRFMRLNFSNRPPALIDEGMKRLGEAARSLLASAIS